MTKEQAADILNKSLEKLRNIESTELTPALLAEKIRLVEYVHVLEQFLCLPPIEYQKVKDSLRAKYDELVSTLKELTQLAQGSIQKNVVITENIDVVAMFVPFIKNVKKINCFTKSRKIELIV
jgi:hypothetical protein